LGATLTGSGWHWTSHWAKSKCDNEKCECKKYCHP